MPSFLCIASYFKGNDFLRSLKACGATVYLVTSQKHSDKAWAKEALDDIFYIQQDEENEWNMEEAATGLAWLMRSKRIDRIVALDDFDVEKGAYLREDFRIPGMGQTTARHFRDKLAMRVEARDAGIPVPGFSSLFNDDMVNKFIQEFPGPWIIKPRGQASATGMKKVYSGEELWEHVHTLGDKRHHFLVEQFKPGDVFHVDSLTVDGKVIFSRVSMYLATPFEVAHGGGIFRSATVPFGSDLEKKLIKLNEDVMKAFGMKYSASHTEFIRNHETGEFYFLETSSRVGGAHLAEMVEASSGVNLWSEWARIEYAVASGKKYSLPKIRKDYSGIIVSLARQKDPDISQFNDPEIVWRMQNNEYHVGLIVQSPKRERVIELLDNYAMRVQRDYHASAPPQAKPNV
ncbi:MAG: ATPase [Lewinellaceae bacterium]|nr:ATPase [Saprospiraceae bacterium]MCB9344533.1 ATPase [Lewinellaceae bacterium]